MFGGLPSLNENANRFDVWVTPFEVLVYGDVNVPDIDFVREKGDCISLSLEGCIISIFSTYPGLL